MFQAQIQRARQSVQQNREYPGVLGDGSGNPYAGRSRYWVRFPAGVDADGITIYSAPRAVRYDGSSAFIAREGTEVLVWRDPYDGVESISRGMPDYADRAGFDARILNPSETISKWWDVRNFIRLLCRPVGNGSTQITIRENPFHVDDYGDNASFAGTLPADQPDLSAYIPAADTHCLCVIFFNFLENEPLVTVSTAQALDSALDNTDYLECVAQLPHHEFYPLVSLELADAQTALTMEDVIEDLRTWLPTPRVYGFPNPVVDGKSFIIRSTHQEIVYDLTVVGNLTVEGELTVL